MKPRLIPLLLVLLGFWACLAWWLFRANSDSRAVDAHGRATGKGSGDVASADLSRSVSSEMKTAVLAALNLPAGPHRLEVTIAAFERWVKAYPNDAMTWGEDNFEGKERVAGMKAGIADWCAQDPAAAAEWVDGMVTDASKVDTVVSLLDIWAKKDGAAAAQWLQTVTNPVQRTQGLQALADTWSKADPVAATQWALQYYTDAQDATAFQTALGNWVQKDVRSATNFVEHLPAGDSQNIAVNNLALQWAAQDPLAASAWAVGLGDPRQRDEALVNVVDSWAQWEPTKAAQAIGNFTDPDTQAAATSALVGRWVNSDAVAASAWINLQPAGDVKDIAITSFTNGLFYHDPTTSLNWALAIGDPTRRGDQLAALGGAWLNYDPATAQDWINAHMPAEVKNQLLSTGEENASANNPIEASTPPPTEQPTGPLIYTLPTPEENAPPEQATPAEPAATSPETGVIN